MTLAETVLFAADRTFVPPDTYDAFFAVIERLETALERESVALAAQRHGEIADLTRQKRQGFLELNRIMPSLQQAIPSQDIIDRLAAFRRKVEANEAMLRRQMQAVQEVIDLIVRAMQDFESDGTYSRGYGADWNDA